MRRSEKFCRLFCNLCHAGYEDKHLTQLMEPVDVYSQWLNECKKTKQGMFKQQSETAPSAGDKNLDYEVPDDDAWLGKEDGEDESEDGEEEDGDYEPPSKKRSKDDEGDEDENDKNFRDVAKIVGDEDAGDLLKEFASGKSDDDD